MLLASPIRWIDAEEDGEDGELTALSVGTLNGKQRKERVAVLHALATRVATHSSNFQSQRTETTTLPSSAATSNSHLPPQRGPLSNGHGAPQAGAAFTNQAQSQNQPVSNGHATLPNSQPTSIQPAPATDLSTASLHDPPRQSKPQIINMPPPPINMERTKTDFFTPPSDPSELKQLS